MIASTVAASTPASMAKCPRWDRSGKDLMPAPAIAGNALVCPDNRAASTSSAKEPCVMGLVEGPDMAVRLSQRLCSSRRDPGETFALV